MVSPVHGIMPISGRNSTYPQCPVFPSHLYWEGQEWQSFALQLVQLRHGHENIQIIPDKVKGDAGIEFIFLGGALYQCYAPEEATDVSKAANAQKSKASKDIKKLITYKDKLESLLNKIKINRWILLCPFLDDKDVVDFVRNKGLELRNQALPFIGDDFEALVHSQEDFSNEIDHLKKIGGMPFNLANVSATAPSTMPVADIEQRLTEKLTRGLGNSHSSQNIANQRDAYVRAQIKRENVLDELKRNHPSLWERSLQCLDAEEERLIALGSSSDIPAEKLKESIERVEASLGVDLPLIARSLTTIIAIGTVSDWLFRCPLDFPEK